MSWLRDALDRLPDPDPVAAAQVRARADDILRPAGAFARLDDVAVHIAAWQRTASPAIERPAGVVFAADHGVAFNGAVSAYPTEVTAAMLEALEQKRATVSALAHAVGAKLHDLPGPAARGCPEGGEGGDDLDDDLIRVEEDDVDGKPHERRVDRPGRP